MLLLCPIELAAGFEPAGPSRCDVVVKLTMTPGRHELAALAAQQESLHPTGSTTFPPDAGRRPSPEVIVVGPALDDPSGPVSLRVGDSVWNARAWRDLGPAAQPEGAHARPRQRVGKLDLPLLVEAKSRTWMKVVIPGPVPMFGIAAAAGSPVRPIAGRLEVLAIDPARRLLMLTFRIEIPDTTAVVVVNPNARATLPVAGELVWPRRTLAPLVAGANLGARSEPASGLPFSRSKGLTVDAPRHVRSQALPFSRAAPASAPPVSAPPSAPASAPPPSEPPEGVGFETVLLGKSPAYTGNETVRLTGVPFLPPSLPFQVPPAPTFGPRPGSQPTPTPEPSPHEDIEDGPTFAGQDDVEEVEDLDDDHETIPPAPRDTIPPSDTVPPSEPVPPSDRVPPSGRTLLLTIESPETAADDPTSEPVTMAPPPLAPPGRETIPPDAAGPATLPPPAPSNGGLPFAVSSTMPRPPSMKSTTFAELRALTSAETAMTAMSSDMFDDDRPAPVAGARPVERPAVATETTRLELTIEGFTLDQLSAIRAELQAAPRSKRRGILRKHETTEVKWRLVERKWANHLRELEARPEQLVLVATSLQRKGKRRRSRSSERTA